MLDDAIVGSGQAVGCVNKIVYQHGGGLLTFILTHKIYTFSLYIISDLHLLNPSFIDICLMFKILHACYMTTLLLFSNWYWLEPITMAQCKQTAEEFIQDVFSPLIAVLCSSDVDRVCQKNNLSFVELIQPFCHLTSEGFECYQMTCVLKGAGQARLF